MENRRKFLVDVDDGNYITIFNAEVVEGERMLDDAYELVNGYLLGTGLDFTCFNLIDITDVVEFDLY